jgi:hypothetical protein
MTFQDIFNFLTTITVWHLLKIFILMALLVYLVFSILVLRQVKIMTETFKTGFELPLRIISWVHLILVCLLIVIGLVVL